MCQPHRLGAQVLNPNPNPNPNQVLTLTHHRLLRECVLVRGATVVTPVPKRAGTGVCVREGGRGAESEGEG